MCVHARMGGSVGGGCVLGMSASCVVQCGMHRDERCCCICMSACLELNPVVMRCRHPLASDGARMRRYV